METSVPIVRSATVVAQRLFDIAYAIDLTVLRRLRGPETGRGTESVKALPFGAPPCLLPLDPVDVEINGRRITAKVSARVYEFGAVALSLSFAVADMAWPDFVEFTHGVDRAVGAEHAATMWAALRDRLRAQAGPSLERPSESDLQEDFLLIMVKGFDTPLTAAELHQRIDLVPLLSGEPRPLSEASRRELLGRQFSYFIDDCAVLTRDRAFIYEPSGDSGVAAVLEVANAQLLELRYYDALLNDELPRMYDLVAQTRRALNIMAPRRLADLARKLYTLVAEVTELTEKVDNALQVTQNPYLARIYTASLDLFGVPAIGAAVDRKLSIIRDTYAALYDEASVSRAGLLELTIILLIAVEIMLAVLRP